MDRRAFLTAVAGLLVTPLAAGAQQAGRVYRVGIISAAALTPNRAFVDTLRALGYVEGQNIVIEHRSAEGQIDRYADIIEELLQRKVDVLVTVTNIMAERAKERTSTVPIVMAFSVEPQKAGLVASLARPGGNITGLTFDTGPEFQAKRLELFKEAVPKLSRVTGLGSRIWWEGSEGSALRAAAQRLAMVLSHAENTAEYGSAFAVIMRERPDGLFVSGDPRHFANQKLIVDFVAKSRLPSSFYFREAVDAGGLMSYGVNLPNQYRRAAVYVDKILNGAKPADLPVEQPANVELVINLKTAKALGLAIPQSLLLRADQVIQ